MNKYSYRNYSITVMAVKTEQLTRKGVPELRGPAFSLFECYITKNQCISLHHRPES